MCSSLLRMPLEDIPAAAGVGEARRSPAAGAGADASSRDGSSGIDWGDNRSPAGPVGAGEPAPSTVGAGEPAGSPARAGEPARTAKLARTEDDGMVTGKDNSDMVSI